MNFYTADTHFNHKNIIKYEDRPFNSVEEMDESLIARWNAVVGDDDHVFHLGDFAFSTNPDRYLARLNGHKHLIIGNHDGQPTRHSHLWESVAPYREIKDEGINIVLCHYAMRVWNKSHHGSLMLYGHSHGNLPGTNQSLDVGVDNDWNYMPIDIGTIQDRLKTLPPYRNEDHHVPNPQRLPKG